MIKLNRLFLLIIAIAVVIAVFLFVDNSESKVSVDNPARRLIERIEAGETFMFDGKSTIQRNERTLNGKMTIAGSSSEKRSYLDQVIGVDGLESRVIAFSDHDNRTVIMTALQTISLGKVDLATYEERSEKAKEGVGTVDGRSLPYIRYESKNTSSVYYIDGDKIYALVMKKQSSEDIITLIVDNYSSEIPDEFFQIPNEYAKYHTVDNR